MPQTNRSQIKHTDHPDVWQCFWKWLLPLEWPACVSVSDIVLLSPQLGLDIEELEEIEEDAGLGNGGLGRLAGKHSRNGLYHLGNPFFSSTIHNHIWKSQLAP